MTFRFALVAAVLALCGTALASYDSFGFEPQTFVPGLLDTQDGWSAGAGGGGLDPRVVTAPDPVVGTQSVRLEVPDVQGANSWMTKAVAPVTPGPGVIVLVQFDVYRLDRLNQNLWWWWTEAGDPTYGLQWDIGGTRPFGFSGSEVPTVKGVWTTILMEWNLDTMRANSWYNGVPVDVNYPITGVSSLSEWTFYLSHDAATGSGADTAWIDNFAIRVIPEPASLLLVGLGLLLRRR